MPMTRMWAVPVSLILYTQNKILEYKVPISIYFSLIRTVTTRLFWQKVTKILTR